MTKIPTLTLTPNRSPGPKLGRRLVVYRREATARGDVVRAFRWTTQFAPDGSSPGEVVEEIDIRRIRECPADREFEDAWLRHVDTSPRAHLTLAQRA